MSDEPELEAETFVQPLSGEPDGAWHHFQGDSEANRTAARNLGVPEQVLEALFEAQSSPRRAVFAGGDLVILRGVTGDDIVSVRIWLTGPLIVTTAMRPIQAVETLRDRFALGRGPTTAPDMLLAFATILTERLKEAVRATEGELEGCEDRLLDSFDASEANTLRQIRSRAISLRRFAEPQLDALEDLLEDPSDWLTDQRRLQLREIVEATERAVNSLMATREHVAAVQDQITLHLTERTRITGQVLTVVATIFLPLHLIAGLWGMNVGGIPYASSPIGFWAITGFIALILIAALVYVIWSLRSGR
jgi:zinc transporter